MAIFDTDPTRSDNQGTLQDNKRGERDAMFAALANSTEGEGGTRLDADGNVIERDGIAVTGKGKGKGKDLNFRPQDLELGGIGSIDSTKHKKGNFGLEVNEAEATTQMRELLAGETQGAFGASGALRDPTAQVGQQSLDAAGNVLGAFGSFDPMTAASERFDKLDAILQPGRERERSGLESRLFAQGRLDSTAGSRELGEYQAAIERERAGMLDRQFGEAQGAQANLANIAGGLSQTGGNIQSGIFNQGLQGIQGGNALSEPMLRLLGLSTQMGQATAQTKLQKQAIKEAPEQSSGTMGAIGTVLGGAAGAYFGAGNPAAISAGATVGGAAGGMMDS